MDLVIVGICNFDGIYRIGSLVVCSNFVLVCTFSTCCLCTDSFITNKNVSGSFTRSSSRADNINSFYIKVKLRKVDICVLFSIDDGIV
ncbi:Uncharacterised protein [Segatella copri]|nr:Uncharacterised protein [Segatella copri]